MMVAWLPGRDRASDVSPGAWPITTAAERGRPPGSVALLPGYGVGGLAGPNGLVVVVDDRRLFHRTGSIRHAR